jgi:hypothetical protein
VQKKKKTKKNPTVKEVGKMHIYWASPPWILVLFEPRVCIITPHILKNNQIKVILDKKSLLSKFYSECLKYSIWKRGWGK